MCFFAGAAELACIDNPHWQRAGLNVLGTFCDGARTVKLIENNLANTSATAHDLSKADRKRFGNVGSAMAQ